MLLVLVRLLLIVTAKASKQVKRARDEGSKCEKQMWKANVLKLFFHTLIFLLFFIFIILFFYSVFCLFFIFCFWLVFILTLSTFAFSICKGEGISFLYFSQRLFILLLLMATAVVTLKYKFNSFVCILIWTW